MNAPADKTAKRISIEEWFARYDLLELLKQPAQPAQRTRRDIFEFAPADRTAVRA